MGGRYAEAVRKADNSGSKCFLSDAELLNAGWVLGIEDGGGGVERHEVEG